VFKVLGFFRSALGAAAQGCAPPAFRPRVNYCEAVALKLFVFHPDDHVYPCPEIAGAPTHALGTYRPWLRLDQTQVARWRRQTVLDREDCHDCVISTLCGGGCALAALTGNGTMGRPACEGALQLVRAWFSRLHAALP
jgi:uncharacterized protein